MIEIALSTVDAVLFWASVGLAPLGPGALMAELIQGLPWLMTVWQDTDTLSRYAWLSIAAALATIVLKFAAYFVTGSVALFSDAAESLINLVGAGFALVILAVAAKPADQTHPFGHGKAEYFSSGFEGGLILVAALTILVQAWHRWWNPVPLAELDVGFVATVIATVINGGVGLLLVRAGRHHRSITLEADGQHLLTDVWTSVAVLAGLAGLWLTGWLWLDPLTAGLAALNIMATGIGLVRRSLSGMLGEALPSHEMTALEQILDGYRGEGVQFHDLRASPYGAQRLVTMHVLVPGEMTVQAGHDLLERIESDIRIALTNTLIITHIEPQNDRASFAHEMLEIS